MLLMLMIFSVVSQTSSIWQKTTAKFDQFRNARAGFLAVTQNLREATLNSYLDFDSPTVPTKYLRKSNLHFVADQATSLVTMPPPAAPSVAVPGPTHAVFFQAPLGFSQTIDNNGNAILTNDGKLGDLLCALGYFIEFCGDDLQKPPFINTRFGTGSINYRYRLMEFKQPTENLSVYTSGGVYTRTWFQTNLSATSANIRPIADNIVALVIRERPPSGSSSTLAPAYAYDSRPRNPNSLTPPQPVQENQLPPLLDITLVAISEDSAKRLAARYGTNPPPILDPSWFQNAADSNYVADLAALTTALDKGRLADGKTMSGLDYRIFTTTIQLKETK